MKIVLDMQNYNENLEEIRREAVRAIIVSEGKLLMIEDSNGNVKFPGGGKENNETDIQTLFRETMEETGFTVNIDSVCMCLEIEEKRLSSREMMIWHQYNRYYVCNVQGPQGNCTYSENEKRNGYHQIWCDLDAALLRMNDHATDSLHINHLDREYIALLFLKNHIFIDATLKVDTEW